MNKDHVHNLEDFLVIYGHVDQTMAQRNPRLETITLDAMTISFIDMGGSKENVKIFFQPSLDSLDDARIRLVEMSQNAAKKRGFSEHIVKKIPILRNWYDVPIFITMGVLYYWAMNLNSLLALVANFSTPFQELIREYYISFFRVLVIIHVLESVLILYPLLRKYRVNIFQKLTALSITMVEGGFYINDFNRKIDEVSNPKKTN
ncbi:hypothetical protein JL09_g1784 [Pichia kudriavzevii]|nr:hypothetical protein JL09_g1784 [Pichia kudriavzevii]